jgi:hypothetical protein
MDNNLSQQAAQIAENKQTAAQQLMAGGASMITSGLQAVEGKANKAASPTITTIDTAPGAEAAVAAGRETRINPTSYVAPMVTPETKITDEEARKLRGY